jgi:hypothetical protein
MAGPGRAENGEPQKGAALAAAVAPHLRALLDRLAAEEAAERVDGE